MLKEDLELSAAAVQWRLGVIRDVAQAWSGASGSRGVPFALASESGVDLRL